MLIKSKFLRRKIREVWPNLSLQKITLWDPVYWLISEKTISDLIEKSNVHKMDFIPQFNDCDNYALQFQAEVRRKRYLAYKTAQKGGDVPEELKYPVAIAIGWGSMWRGMSKNHIANLFVCREGIYLADLTPMEKRHWKADAKNDKMLDIDFR